MKRKTPALTIALLVLIGATILSLRTTPRQGAGQGSLETLPETGNDAATATAVAPDRSDWPDAGTARRLSPEGWTPPAFFAETGVPAPKKPFPRGENASRRHPEPVTRELPRELRNRTPVVLAKTPEDGRLHLLPEEIDLHTRLAHRMVLDTAALDHIVAGNASRLIAPSIDDEVIMIEFHAVKTRSPQSHTLLGRVVGEEETSDVILVYHDGVIHGSVARYADTVDQHLEYRIMADGHMMVRELDPTTMAADCGNGAHTETAADGMLDGQAGAGLEIIPQADGEIAGDTPGWRTVDVVVGYDQGARIADGGYSQIEARIISSVDRMTTAFANSLITNTEMMLLGTIEDPNYVFPGTSSGSQSDELGALNNFSDGVLDTVSNYCTTLGADLIAFVPKQADGSAGLAYRPGRSSITARDYMTSTRITFAHELGHNLGCDHSWGDSSQSYHTHYGWRLEPPGATRVRTIMAYDWGWGTGQRIPYYANPTVSFNGAATGAVNGYNVLGDATADQRYYQNGLNYTNGVFGFNGANSGLGANNSNTVNTGAGNSSYGATFASNRATRTSFAVTSPVAGVELNRGASQNVFFRGGDMKDLATIDLFKGGVFQTTLASNLNPATRRNYTWNISQGLLAGSDYMIRVTLNHPEGGTSTADSGIFTILGSAPIIASHSPTPDPAVNGPVSQLSITFSQPMDPASFSLGADIVSFTGPQGAVLSATGASWSGGNTVLNIQFNAQASPGYYRMVIGAGIASPDGFFLDQNLNDIPGESFDDRYIATFQISGGAGSPETIWSDMVLSDSPDAGWSFSGTNSSWETGIPSSNPATTYDGGPVMGQNLGGNYNTNENSYAQSPVIDCGAHSNITLSFRGWKGAGKNDTLYVDAWNGSSWQRVYSYNGPNGGANDTTWAMYQPALGTHGDFNPDFRLRWGLTDVTNGGSGVQTGWQLEAIVVQGVPDASPPAAWVTTHSPQGFVEDFHSSVWLEFSQPMDTGSFALGDIASFTGPAGSIVATGFQWLHPTMLRVDFPAQSALGQYALTLAPGVLDQNGHPLDQDFDGTPGESGQDSYVAAFQIGSTAGPLEQFVITGMPSSVIYGTTVNGITITARDAANKIAASFNGTVIFGGTAGITGTSANFSDGVLSNFSITPLTIGNGLTFTVDDGGGHIGSANFTVTPIPATIAIVGSSLSQTYNGSPRIVTAITDPPGLDYIVTYQGEPDPPVNAGGYDVSATITEPNYQGNDSEILIVAKASQSIDFAPLGTVGNDQETIILTATASSGLPVSYTSSNPAVATVSGNVLDIIADGTTTITASQPGNNNFDPAANVPQSLTVLRVQPIASPGGPYKVLVGQTLSLDGSASLASEGETLTGYEWDLNDDGIFGDATGANPIAITFNDLKNVWGMGQGSNPIHLRVTDSASKIAVESTTVELVQSLQWDANGTGSGQTNGGGAWLAANLWWDGTNNVGWFPGSNAFFGGSGSAGGAVTLSGPTNVNNISFNTFTGTYTLGTAGQTLTIIDGVAKNAGSAAVTFVSPVTFGGDQTWTNHSTGLLLTGNGANLIDNAGHSLTVDGAGGITFGVANNAAATLSGSGALIKNGTGVLTVGGDNSAIFSGNVTLNGGILFYGDNPGSLGAGNIHVTDGVIESRWQTGITRTQGPGPGAIRITGGESGFAGNGNTAVTFNIGAITWGSETFNPAKLLLQTARSQQNSNITLSSAINLNGADRTIVVNGGTTGAARAILSGIISNGTGTAGLVKEGTGMLNITQGSSAWNGPTTVQGGILDFGSMSNPNIGGGSGRNIIVAAGTGVRFNTLSNTFLNRIVETSAEITVMTSATTNNLDFSSGAGANLPNAFLGNWASNGGKMEYSGTLTPANDAYRLGGTGSNGLLAMVGTNKLTGARGLIVGGTGASGIRVMLSGANNHTGDTVINSGAKLTLANNLALQNSALDLGAAGGNFALNSAGTVTDAVAASSPTFGGLKGSRSLLSAFTNAGGNNEANLAATSVTGFTLNPGSGKIYQYSGVIADFAPGTTLDKTGAGTQIFSGNHTYTGATMVTDGKLIINGSLTNVDAPLNVIAGATLSGTGTVGRNVTIDAGGKLEFNIGTPAATHDPLNISSGRSFAFAGASELTIVSSGGAQPGLYTLVTGGNNISGAAPSTLNLPDGWNATVYISDNSLLLDVIATSGPGPVASFAISPIGSPQVVGTPVTGITVTALDAIGQTATGFTGIVTFGGTAGATGESVNFAEGVLTGVSITPTAAGSNLTFTVDDGAGHIGSTAFNVISVYDNWSGGAGFDQDTNGDGLANGLAWALGAADPSANALALLPSLDYDNDFIIYTFRRADAANGDPDTTIAAEYGSALDAWTSAVHDGTDVVINEFNDDYGTGIDRVQVKIRKTLATDGRMFLRLGVRSDATN